MEINENLAYSEYCNYDHSENNYSIDNTFLKMIMMIQLKSISLIIMMVMENKIDDTHTNAHIHIYIYKLMLDVWSS